MSDTDNTPLTTVQDRHYLCLTYDEYKNFAEAVANNCFLNEQGQHCSITRAKLKKLKNIRANIRRFPYLMKSLVWKEQMRLLEREIKRRQHGFK